MLQAVMFERSIYYQFSKSMHTGFLFSAPVDFWQRVVGFLANGVGKHPALLLILVHLQIKII